MNGKTNPLHPQAAANHPLLRGFLPSQACGPDGTRNRPPKPSQEKDQTMKIVAMIARYLLGLMFLVFGSNMFLQFIPMGPMPPGLAGQFTVALFAAHYFYVVGAIMVVSAILFLINRFVGLGLTLLGPVLFNILLFHLTMNPGGIGAGAFATLLWLLVAWEHRIVFERLFAPRLEE
jgi:putative oxidoreductase